MLKQSSRFIPGRVDTSPYLQGAPRCPYLPRPSSGKDTLFGPLAVTASPWDRERETAPLSIRVPLVIT
jgi:hypothetical protein